MKQHITEQQFLELSDKGKLNIHEWWFNHVQKTIRQDIPCLLSIGQMIEFCLHHGDTLEKIQNESSDLFNKHRIVLTFKPQAFMNYGHEIRWAHDTELCDALWEAVKEVLET